MTRAWLAPRSHLLCYSCRLWASGKSLAFSLCGREQSGLDPQLPAGEREGPDRPREELPKRKRDVGNGPLQREGSERTLRGCSGHGGGGRPASCRPQGGGANWRRGQSPCPRATGELCWECGKGPISPGASSLLLKLSASSQRGVGAPTTTPGPWGPPSPGPGMHSGINKHWPECRCLSVCLWQPVCGQPPHSVTRGGLPPPAWGGRAHSPDLTQPLGRLPAGRRVQETLGPGQAENEVTKGRQGPGTPAFSPGSTLDSV